ncbi:MAG: GW dipeptide domain-containing protein [Planctomycetota bacterium]|jgi:hypothetical protein
MKLTLTAISIVIALAMFSCRQKEQEPKQQQVQSHEHEHPQQSDHPQQQAGAGVNLRTGVVQEVLQANAYTYLKLKEKDKDYWIAITKREIKAGETVSFAGGLEMKNFESKDLQRTFETIYFVDRIAVGEAPAAATEPGASQPSMSTPHQTKPLIEKQEISVEPAEGGITIGELFANKDSYADKTVVIKGQVTKVNRAIMGRDWVHLQDGTRGSGKFDLTITTKEQVNVGDVVTFEGKISLNKDFGAGYAYDVLMEEARRKTQ